MKFETLFLIYLIIINLLSGIIFAFDKHAAIKSRRRIHERTLHFLEITGGVFAIFLLMYSLHHKNRKFGYYAWTWGILIGWMIVIYLLWR
jgi:uncharacterized membrane protein YsdA (DUF1294 family)